MYSPFMRSGVLRTLGIALSVISWAATGWAQDRPGPDQPPTANQTPAPDAAPDPGPDSPPDSPDPPTDSDSDSDARLQALEAALRAQSARIEAQDRALDQQQKRIQELEEAAAEPDIDELLDGTAAEYTEPRRFRLSGFADIGWRREFLKDTAAIRPFVDSLGNSFVLGNLDLLFDFQPHSRWRHVLEVRFTNATHGQPLQLGTPFGDEYDITDLEVPDSGNLGSVNVVVGGVVIERAWIEYAHRDWLNVRAGLFFTPSGIWNLDHGSPTLIALNMPLGILRQRFPRRQLGIQLHGRARRGDWAFRYHAYASNGRTPGNFDLTDDKALGGRVVASTRRGRVELALGASGYHGRYVDQARNVISFSPFIVSFDELVSYTETVAGLDLSLDVGPLRIRSEGSLNRIVYREGMRAPAPTPGAYQPDAWRWNWYALAAYRFARYNLEPFVYLEFQHEPNPWGDTATVIGLGLNYHIHPGIVWKTQYNRSDFRNLFQDQPTNTGDNYFARLATALAIAF